MKRIVMTIILVLGLVSLLPGCATHRLLMVNEKGESTIREESFWASTTVGVIGKDGNVTWYNDRYPPPGNINSKTDNKGTSYQATFPSYGYNGYGYGGYGYGRGYYGRGYGYSYSRPVGGIRPAPAGYRGGYTNPYRIVRPLEGIRPAPAGY